MLSSHLFVKVWSMRFGIAAAHTSTIRTTQDSDVLQRAKQLLSPELLSGDTSHIEFAESNRVLGQASNLYDSLQKCLQAVHDIGGELTFSLRVLRDHCVPTLTRADGDVKN